MHNKIYKNKSCSKVQPYNIEIPTWLIFNATYDSAVLYVNIIDELYDNNCAKLVIANSKSSNTIYAINFMDIDDMGFDLVFIQNNQLFQTNYTKNKYDTVFPGITFSNFTIINTIFKDYTE